MGYNTIEVFEVLDFEEELATKPGLKKKLELAKKKLVAKTAPEQAAQTAPERAASF